MTIATGDKLPEATFLEKGDKGIAPVPSARRCSPGARSCSSGCRAPIPASARPSTCRASSGWPTALRAKGVDEIVCVAVNDPHVMLAWSEATGAGRGRDPHAGRRGRRSSPGRSGMDVRQPGRRALRRSKRYAMLAEDGAVAILNIEASTGQCEISAGETLLDAL